jgi:membrane fusion protein, copper/silver efflux system
MKPSRTVGILGLAAVGWAALAGSWACGRRTADEARRGQEPAQAVEYSCAMHPQIVRDRPGDCPICGMKLQKRTRQGVAPPEAEGAVPGRAAVSVPPERVPLLGIRSEPVGGGSGAGVLRTVGRVAADERRRQVVHAKYEGYVERLHVDFTGQPVRKGQPLLELYSPELVAAQTEYLLARRAQERLDASGVPGVAQGGADLAEASRQRLRYYDLGAEEIAALERSGDVRRTMTLRSPAAGVVVQKMAFSGQKVSAADRLYEIADLSRVWVLADLYEKDLAAARPGAPARVSLPYQPGREWRGRIAFVSPTVKPDTRTVEVRIELENAEGLLRPDMFADVHLEAEGGAGSLPTVPESAVIHTGERTLVFVDQGQGRYEPREVRLGARVAGAYHVLRGVAAGERVVVSASFLLDSESSLRAGH